jgi:hypothetical protein
MAEGLLAVLCMLCCLLTPACMMLGHRYWPDNPRVRNGIVPGRYGNMAGAKKLWYYYLGKLEGGGPAGPK